MDNPQTLAGWLAANWPEIALVVAGVTLLTLITSATRWSLTRRWNK